jgi:hypothetical protein
MLPVAMQPSPPASLTAAAKTASETQVIPPARMG